MLLFTIYLILGIIGFPALVIFIVASVIGGTQGNAQPPQAAGAAPAAPGHPPAAPARPQRPAQGAGLWAWVRFIVESLGENAQVAMAIILIIVSILGGIFSGVMWWKDKDLVGAIQPIAWLLATSSLLFFIIATPDQRRRRALFTSSLLVVLALLVGVGDFVRNSWIKNTQEWYAVRLVVATKESTDGKPVFEWVIPTPNGTVISVTELFGPDIYRHRKVLRGAFIRPVGEVDPSGVKLGEDIALIYERGLNPNLTGYEFRKGDTSDTYVMRSQTLKGKDTTLARGEYLTLKDAAIAAEERELDRREAHVANVERAKELDEREHPEVAATVVGAPKGWNIHWWAIFAGILFAAAIVMLIIGIVRHWGGWAFVTLTTLLLVAAGFAGWQHYRQSAGPEVQVVITEPVPPPPVVVTKATAEGGMREVRAKLCANPVFDAEDRKRLRCP